MGGSTSGFAHVAEAYWTTIVVTVVVSVVCLALAIATYVFRMDQRMRQDRHYGKGKRGGGTRQRFVISACLPCGKTACIVSRHQQPRICAGPALHHLCTEAISSERCFGFLSVFCTSEWHCTASARGSGRAHLYWNLLCTCLPCFASVSL